MVRFFFAIVALAFACSAAPAQEARWAVEELNQTVDQTNVIVGQGCSGTIISVEKKLVLTNNHCVKQNLRTVKVDELQEDGTYETVKKQVREPIMVTQSVRDDVGRVIGSRSSKATINRADEVSDLALLSVVGPVWSTQAAKILPEGNAARGERVYSVGNPAGYESTVVEGIVSNVRREMPSNVTSGEPWELMQISGGIFFGNSGGALYNTDGYLVGVPAAVIPAATHLGFAVPADIIRTFLGKACQAELFGGKNDAACK